MPLKAVLVINTLVIVTISEPSGIQGNTSIAKLNKQSVKWYKEMIT